MLKVKDIRKSLINEIHNGTVKEVGYKCLNGDRYIEIRNVVFECDEDCIFSNIPKLPYLEDSWYAENYSPLLLQDDQLVKAWNKLADNPNSRQAVIIISSTDNLQCTMYMHVSLIKCNEGYELEYVVHMRSNDSIEFRSDLKWHKNVYKYLFNRLSIFYDLKRKNIIWNVDSLQLYEQYFGDAVKCSD